MNHWLMLSKRQCDVRTTRICAIDQWPQARKMTAVALSYPTICLCNTFFLVLMEGVCVCVCVQQTDDFFNQGWQSWWWWWWWWWYEWVSEWWGMQQLAQLLAALAVFGRRWRRPRRRRHYWPVHRTVDRCQRSKPPTQTDWRSVSVWTLRKASCVSPSVCPVSPEKT